LSPHDPEKWEPVSRLREASARSGRVDKCFGGRRQVGQDHAAKEMPNDLACELLAQSLVAWRVAGSVERARDGALMIGGTRNDIRINRAPPHSMFRWMVTVDGRTRGAISLVGVLRQVREALDQGYATNRLRIAPAPLVPS